MADLLSPDGALMATLIPMVACAIAAVVLYVLLGLLGRRLLDDPAEAGALARTAFIGVLAVGVLLGLGRLVDREATDAGLRAALAGIVGALPGLTISFILLIGALLVAAVLRATVTRVVRAVRPSVAGSVGAIVYWTVVVLAVLISAEQAGIDVAILRQLLLLFIAGLIAATALGVGLGLRQLMGSIFAGRHVEQVVTRGDTVEIGAARGRVESVGHASVRLRTEEGIQWEVPHAAFLDAIARVEEHEPDA